MQSMKDSIGLPIVNLALGGSNVPESLLCASSYHVFEEEGYRILYDLGTNAIIEVTDPAMFNMLSLADKAGVEEITKSLKDSYPGTPDSFVTDTIEQMLESGLFQDIGSPDDRDQEIESVIARLKSHQTRRIEIFVSQACNLACIYCYCEENGSNAIDRLMDFETAKRSIDFLVEKSGNRRSLTLMFFGGEPLLNFEVIRRMVDYAKSIEAVTNKRFYYQISTNGTLLTEEIQDFIVQHKMGTLVSIDGDQETHDMQRPFRDGSGGSFDLVLRNALSLDKKFREIGILFKARANVTRFTKDPEQTSEKLSDLGFEFIGISDIYDRPNQNTVFSLTKEQGLRMCARSREEIFSWLDNLDTNGESAYRNRSRTKDNVGKCMDSLSKPSNLCSIYCGVGRNTNAVDVDGNIYPCHRFVGMENYILGNIDSGLDDEKMTRFYTNLLRVRTGKCWSCWVRHYCMGLCPWRAAHENGQIEIPSDDFCEDIKKGFKFSMYIFVRLGKKHPKLLLELTNYRTILSEELRRYGLEEVDDQESQPSLLS
jgi:uncharacterized protein